MSKEVWNKADLVDALRRKRPELSKQEVKALVEDLMDTVMDVVAQGGQVRLSGFGKFEAVDRAPRTGRNPHTGEEVPIPATSVPQFKPGKLFREGVEER
ncbi:HU family DNA-binding protein [Thiohalorhabdus sp. Cl-TMA]|uniref:HU family DNA-binding protein n=1 Tax=Thiohalorhabdus methylotrophus TaxID=3242694 RepID=A0ABV4TX33_9GAMM